jgi:hypothetical protein
MSPFGKYETGHVAQLVRFYLYPSRHGFDPPRGYTHFVTMLSLWELTGVVTWAKKCSTYS